MRLSYFVIAIMALCLITMFILMIHESKHRHVVAQKIIAEAYLTNQVEL